MGGVAILLTIACGIAGLGAATPDATVDGTGEPARSIDGQRSGPFLSASLQTGPTANLSITPSPAHPNGTVSLDATGSTAPGDETVTGCSFDVDGDGSYDVSTESCRYETRYDETGEYDVGVRVTSSSGQSATDVATAVVRANVAPSPVVHVDPEDPTADRVVTLSGTESADSDGSIVTYDWSIDGTRLRGETVTYRFESTETVSVTLAVTDDDGATNETSETIRVVSDRPPTAAVVVEPTSPSVGDRLTLDASESTDDGTIVGYRWDLDGDGTVDRQTAASRTTITAEEAGDRRSTVTVVDDRNATDSATVEYAVGPRVTATPTAIVTATDTSALPARGDGDGLLDRLDPGFVPYLPDWFALLLLAAVAGGLVTVRHRNAVRERLSEYRERVRTGRFRRKVAKSASGFVAKTVAKKALRRGADVVEFVANGIGDVLERVGRAIKDGGQRVADWLRRLGG